MLRQISLVVVALVLVACAGTTETGTPAPSAPPLTQCPEPPPAPLCPEPIVPPALQCPEPVQCPPAPACPKPSPLARKLDDKLLLGAVEIFDVQPGNMKLEARVDTGATTTSLHATNVVVFERDGERWVRFDADTGAGKQPVTLELPWVRRVRIKGEGEEVDPRPVIMIEISADGVSRRVEATLNDRSNYEYPLLVGRNFLRDTAVVDVGRSYVLGK